MSERKNTLVCTFDPHKPRISAFDIHEWIYKQLHVPENAKNMVQVEGPRRQVYINFAEIQCFAGITPFEERQIRIQTRQWGNTTGGNNDGLNRHQKVDNSKSSPRNIGGDRMLRLL